MTLEQFFILSRRRIVLLLISAFAGGALGFLVAVGLPVSYAASSTAYIRASASVSDLDGANAQMYAEERADRLAAGMVGVVMSDAFEQRIGDSLGLVGSEAAASLRITATQPVGTSMVVVSAHASSPWLARRLADEAVWQAATEMEAVESGLRPSDVALLSSAELGAVTRSPSISRSAATGALVALTGAYSWLLLRRARPGLVEGAEEVVSGIGKPVLGNLSFTSAGTEDRGATSVDGRVEEELRFLRTNLLAKGLRVVAVSSAARSEGRTTVCLGLARVLAYSGRDVVVVEADTCRPLLAELFRVDCGPALVDVLNGGAAPEQGLIGTSVPGMSVIVAGTSEWEWSELLDSERLRELFSTLASERMVIVDAPSVGEAGAWSESIAAAVDGVLVVASAGETPSADLRHAVGRLERSSGNRVIGVVLNRRRGRLWLRVLKGIRRMMARIGNSRRAPRLGKVGVNVGRG